MANIGNINISQNNNNVKLQSPTSIEYESFYFDEFYDEKVIRKFIRSVESLIHKYRAYSDYIDALPKVAAGLARDNINPNIEAGSACIQFHHYPFELSEIVEIIMLHNVNSNKKFTTFSMAEEILRLHFDNHIGLIPLSTTNHELQHLGKLVIKKNQIFGDYEYFVNKYYDGLSLDQIDRLKHIETLTENNTPSDYLNLLEVK